MSTLYNGKQKKGSFTYDGDNDYYYITFDEDGEANFWSAPIDPAMDIKMYLYNNDDNDLLETAHNRDKNNRNVLIEKFPVEAGTEYKIRLRHYGGPEGDYYIKAKNYPQDNDDYELEIQDIKLIDEEPFAVNEMTVFRVLVKNVGESESPKYTVYAYDEDGNKLDDDDENELASGCTNYGIMRVTMNKGGNHRLKFVIKVDGDIVCKEYETYTWKSESSTIKDPVYYSQEDSAWKNIMYSNHNDTSQTIGTSGCGPTSMAMVASTLKDREILPPETCKYAVDNGFRTYDEGTSHTFFKSAANKYNIKYEKTSSLNTAIDRLSTGKYMVICSLRKGHFAGGGHFITLYGTEKIDSENFFLVMDPNIDNTRYWRNGNDGVVIEHYKKNDGFVKAKASQLHNENKYKLYHIFSK